MAATEGTPAERWKALAAAALALPGLHAAAADPGVRGDQATLGYQHGEYRESGPRMAVRIDQASITLPLADRYEVKANVTRDITSGASVFSYILAQGQVRAIRSAATIHDSRTAVDAGASFYGDENIVGATLGQSEENDYRSRFATASWRRALNEKATTLMASAGYARDTTWETYYPQQQGSVPEVYRRRSGVELLAGVSQIVDENTVAQISIGRIEQRGWLDSQYRRAAVVINFVPSFLRENRPEHQQTTLLLRGSRYLKPLASALHVDYRFVHDGWGADSHTAEVKWRWNAGGGWILSPGLRYYTQRAADFYDVVFTSRPAAGGALSSDNRLASFNAVSAKLEVVKAFGNGISARAGFEQYERRKGSGRGTELDDYRSRLVSGSVELPF